MLSHINIEEQKYQHAKRQLAEEDGHELRHGVYYIMRTAVVPR